MATYKELREIRDAPGDLIQKIEAACAVTSDAIYREVDGANRDARKPFADEVFGSAEGPGLMARKVLWALLVANKDSSVAQIRGATDAQIQSAVDDYVTQRYGAA